MTSFYSKSSSTCYPWLLIFPGHHQKEVGEARRRGEEQKWFLLPSSITMWHNHSPGLTHALRLLPGDSQAAVMLLWAVFSSWPPTAPLSYWFPAAHPFSLLPVPLTPGQPISWPWKTPMYSFVLKKSDEYFKRATSPLGHQVHRPGFYLCMASCLVTGERSLASLLRR